jgi:hypothetical protein
VIDFDVSKPMTKGIMCCALLDTRIIGVLTDCIAATTMQNGRQSAGRLAAIFGQR